MLVTFQETIATCEDSALIFSFQFSTAVVNLRSLAFNTDFLEASTCRSWNSIRIGLYFRRKIKAQPLLFPGQLT